MGLYNAVARLAAYEAMAHLWMWQQDWGLNEDA